MKLLFYEKLYLFFIQKEIYVKQVKLLFNIKYLFKSANGMAILINILFVPDKSFFLVFQIIKNLTGFTNERCNIGNELY